MKNFVHYIEQVVTAPVLIISHDIGHDAVYFLDHLHFKQLVETELLAGDNDLHDFDSERIELTVAHLEVVYEHADQVEFLQNGHEGLVPIHNHTQQFQPK